MIKTALAPFGMEVSGPDIQSIPASSFDDVARLIASSRAVVFRNQKLDDSSFVQFLSGLGELTFTQGEKPVENVPELNIVSNLGRQTPPRSVFHTDTSYVLRLIPSGRSFFRQKAATRFLAIKCERRQHYLKRCGIF